MTTQKFSKPDFNNLNNSIRFYTGNISHEKNLGAYFQDCHEAISNFETQQFGDFDDNGLPRCGHGSEAYYNVIYIIQYGLIHFDLFLKTSSSTDEKIFLKCADWIFNNAKTFKNDSVCWPSIKPNLKYNLPAGWVSAMYQGQAISLLLRVAQHTNFQKYFDLCDKAFLFFNYTIEEGGAKYIDADNNIWLEEYPSLPPTMVMNGFVYATFGVLDYYRATENQNAKALYELCIKTLKQNMHCYHRWYWSVYDKMKQEMVNPYYMINIHCGLCEILFQLTGEPTFKSYADKWKNSYYNPFKRLLIPFILRLQPRLKKFGINL